MAGKKMNEVVVSKEDAVFWMDRFGRWVNEHGPFEHKKVIDYFNSCIHKDSNGYFVSQIRDDVYEKVYFRYEVTPLFVVDLVIGDKIELLMNTKKRITLKPDHLFVHNDDLFLKKGDEKIKFTDRALLKLSTHLEVEGEKYFFKMGDHRTEIPSGQD